MITLPRYRSWKAGFVALRCRELGQHLAQLSRRVRETVAEVIRETVAQVARDAVDRVLPGGRTLDPGALEDFDDAEAAFDPSADEDEPEAWSQSPGLRNVYALPETRPDAAEVPVARSALSLGLAAAGWWLGRSGTWWGAFAIGLASGAVAAVTRRLTGDGLLLVQAAQQFLTYRQTFAEPSAL